MTRETIRLITNLSRRLKITRANVINQAVYRMAFNNGIAGIDQDWKQIAKERGLPDNVMDYLRNGVRHR
jgi:hypothetical protein